MKGNRKNSRKKRNTQKLNKAGTPPKNTVEQRSSKRQLATGAIAAVDKVVKALKPFELSRGQRLKTYRVMLQDEAIWSSLDSRLSLIQKSQAKGKFKFNKNSEESIKVKDFLEYCLDNLENQNMGLIGRTAADHIYNGFAPFEMVYDKGTKEYSDKWVLRKLVYINPLTLNQQTPYKLSDDGDKILGLRQDFSAFTGDSSVSYFTASGKGKSVDWNGKFIDWRKICSCSYSATIAEPFGISPLDAAYELWRSKQLLEDLEITGSTRDLAGLPMVRIPSALLEAAALDPSGAASAQVAQITSSMELLHKGDQSFVVLPSDTHNEAGTGALEFDFKLLGIDGGGGNFNIDEMIEKKRKGIFTVLASRHLISGEGGGGSYSLQEGEAGIHAHFAERDNLTVDLMINKQIIPKLLKLNGWEVSKKDLPVWEHSPVQDLSSEEQSKQLQRMGAAGLLPKNDPKFMNEVMEAVGFEYEFDENLTPEQMEALCGPATSKSGAGMKEGMPNGTGTSNNNNSATNSDNKA